MICFNYLYDIYIDLIKNNYICNHKSVTASKFYKNSEKWLLPFTSTRQYCSINSTTTTATYTTLYFLSTVQNIFKIILQNIN